VNSPILEVLLLTLKRGIEKIQSNPVGRRDDVLLFCVAAVELTSVNADKEILFLELSQC
jgi:hypothetical protein